MTLHTDGKLAEKMPSSPDGRVTTARTVNWWISAAPLHTFSTLVVKLPPQDGASELTPVRVTPPDGQHLTMYGVYIYAEKTEKDC